MTSGMRVLTGGILALVLSLTACSSAPQSNEMSPDRGEAQSRSDEADAGGSDVTPEVRHVLLKDAVEAPSVIRATRALGLTVLSASPKETMVTSPASSVVALSMLGTTADGEAEDQFAVVLGAPGEQRDEAANALIGTLDPFRADPADIDLEELPENPQIHLANQIAVLPTLKVEPSYTASLAEWFDASLLETDLTSKSGKAELDKWVNENTGGLIKKSAITPDPMLRLVLQNAVLFAAQWQSPFSEAETAPMEFTTGDGREVTVPALNGDKEVRYSEVDGWQMIEMPYGQEGTLVARYVLPPDSTPVGNVTPAELEALEAALEPALVTVSLPKLDLETKAELNAPVQRAGLTAVFSDTPPALGYISTSESLVVSEIIQQGRFIVDELGTVAAATTEIGLATTSAVIPAEPELRFIADRPHLIIVLDKEVGWDLFDVLVNDPS